MIIIIIIYLSWSWATCWPVPVSRIHKSLQRSAIIPSASWGIVFSFRETCQGLKFPLNGLRAQSRVSPVVGLLLSACLGMAFPPFLVKQLYRCDSVVISSFVRTGYTTRRWGWLLGSIGYSITHHYPLYHPIVLCSVEFNRSLYSLTGQSDSWSNVFYSRTCITHTLQSLLAK
jgi:hypothetical protein